MNKTKTAPAALMLLSSHCAHCPSVLAALSELIKQGEIGELKVINLEQYPEAMAQYKVRSVPWVKIGEYELSGAQPLEAFQQRAQWASRDSSLEGQFDTLLSTGKAEQVIAAIRDDNEKFSAILNLLGDPATVLSTRIGIGVVFEEFSGTPLLNDAIPVLQKLTHSEDARIRADAYHYLGLTHNPEVIPLLQQGATDPAEEVAEIAQDALKINQEQPSK